MDRIWAPWRKAYIRPESKKKKGCLFCRLLGEQKDRRNYILKRSLHSFAILNLYPYNNGHAMVVPKRHVDSLHALNDAEKLDLLELHEELHEALQKVMTPHGFNIGINLGIAGGAGIPDHIHMHIVPRWRGDANFMPVLGGVKIISESLDSVYKALLPHLGPSGRGKKKRS